ACCSAPPVSSAPNQGMTMATGFMPDRLRAPLRLLGPTRRAFASAAPARLTPRAAVHASQLVRAIVPATLRAPPSASRRSHAALALSTLAVQRCPHRIAAAAVAAHAAVRSTLR